MNEIKVTKKTKNIAFRVTNEEYAQIERVALALREDPITHSRDRHSQPQHPRHFNGSDAASFGFAGRAGQTPIQERCLTQSLLTSHH